MRSSIACIRCRRSKVKCVNSGVGTTCRSCENAGRECNYPEPIISGARRHDSLSGRPSDGLPVPPDSDRRQRPRKSTHSVAANNTAVAAAAAARESPRPQLDALDPLLLTPQVWQELFDLFQIHYSADLPFLHPPTFLRPLRNVRAQPAASTNFNDEPSKVHAARPPVSPEFLLAFLALTARFHHKLVAHHSPPTSSRPSNPLIASEYYAAAANARMSSMWTENKAHDIEHCQATLMLALHEWGMNRGSRAWLLVGMAVRTAQAFGLQYEIDLDDEPLSRSLALHGEAAGKFSDLTSSANGQSTGELFIQQEIRRRTFWSCYIMDRYLSSGKYRPQMLNARDLRIQLPASERSFLFADKVRTLMLGEEDKNVAGMSRTEVQNLRQQSVLRGTGTPEPNSAPSPRSITMHDAEDEKGRLEVGSEEGLESRYIKILEIYGKVVHWSCSGGRRTEDRPPWDSRSQFYKLNRLCEDFKASLPRQHALTPQNTQAHISLKTSTLYLLVHAVLLLCQITLHREYLPFVPLRCSKPEGPLDPPFFSSDHYKAPWGYWEASARECFRSARDIIELLRLCQEWTVLVETPIVGFATYMAAFVGVYCHHFPWMDSDGYMCTRSDAPRAHDRARAGEGQGSAFARRALETLDQLRQRLHMATGWHKTIYRVHKHMRRAKTEYRRSAATADATADPDGVRDRDFGGGPADDYKQFERKLNDSYDVDDQDVEMTDFPRDSPRPADGAYDDSQSGSDVKSEDYGGRAGQRLSSATGGNSVEGGAWSAINALPGSAASRRASVSTPNSGQFRSYEGYTPQQQLLAPTHTSQSVQQTHSMSSHLNNFRPAYSEGAASTAHSPTLAAKAGTGTAGSPPAHAQPSPPYDRQNPSSHGGWTAQNASYSKLAPRPSSAESYTNGVSHHPQQGHAQYSSASGHTNHQQHQQQQQQHQLQLQQHRPPHQPQSAAAADAQQQQQQQRTLDISIGGDDLACFTEGTEAAAWARHATAQRHAYDATSWLMAVYQSRASGG